MKDFYIPEIHVPLNPRKEIEFRKMSSNVNGCLSLCLLFTGTASAHVNKLNKDTKPNVICCT